MIGIEAAPARMTIPQIRDELLIIASAMAGPDADRIRFLAHETRRRTPIYRKVARRWPRLTPAQAAEVRAFKREFQDVGVKELADIYRTSIGRVSEAIAGKRDGSA